MQHTVHWNRSVMVLLLAWVTFCESRSGLAMIPVR
jgi:hypothetical protein